VTSFFLGFKIRRLNAILSIWFQTVIEEK